MRFTVLPAKVAVPDGVDAAFLERTVRDEVLAALNDVTVSPDLFAEALREPVTGKSLLRNVSRATVRNQFNRLALGGARLSAYEFSYSYPVPRNGSGRGNRPYLTFSVVPESQPLTNVHVIIGRNGVGKSRLLNPIENALIGPDSADHGMIDFVAAGGRGGTRVSQQFASLIFADLVSVAFSAFDDFEPIRSGQDRSRELVYTYVGLKRKSGASADLCYRSAGADGMCGSLRQADFELPDVTAKEMSWIYENRMVGKKSPGRPVYDAIRTASPQGRCPLCGHRDVTTVDHYLTKSAYAALAVNPANLIPACGDCNKMKSSAVLGTLHPYYDNVERDRWLGASVIEQSPPVVQFAVQPPESWSSELADRVYRHFATFELGPLYSMQAARLISGVQALLDLLLRERGSAAVRDHLLQNEASWRQAGQNSWQAACYAALAAVERAVQPTVQHGQIRARLDPL